VTRISVDEFAYWLARQDTAAKVLLVEGARDVRFWSRLVPDQKRTASVIFPIDRIDVPVKFGGNKGRILTLIRDTRILPLHDRLCVFIDADNDHLLSIGHQAIVELTEVRDIECYALSDDAWAGISDALNITEESSNRALTAIRGIGLKFGLLRAANERVGSNLPITDTLFGKPAKYLKIEGGLLKFNEEVFLATLFSAGRGGNGNRERFLQAYAALSMSFKGDFRIAVRGKDALLVASRCISPSLEQCAVAVNSFLLFSESYMRSYPAITRVAGFLETAA
jgi:hypothetical protein